MNYQSQLENSSRGTEHYVQYDNDSQVQALNTNIYNADRTVIMPRHLYGGAPKNQAYYACQTPRDTEVQYIYGVERDEHPQHYSTFGYARAPYGYGSGHWPGRYNTSIWCNQNEQPPNMAPEEYYSPDMLSPYHSTSVGQLMQEYGKNVLMRYYW